MFISDILKEHAIYINDDEIVFLAFHIGAFYEVREEQAPLSVLVSLSKYLNVDEKFLRIMDVFSSKVTFQFDPVHENNLEAYDLIITSDPINTKVPVFYVSPLMTRPEINSMRNVIEDLLKKKAQKNVFQYDNIPKGLFKKNYYPTDDHKVMIEILCRELYQLGYVDQHFCDDVLKRESLSSTALIEGIALPHSLKMKANVNCMSVVINDHPIDWCGSAVYIIILIAFGSDQRDVPRSDRCSDREVI